MWALLWECGFNDKGITAVVALTEKNWFWHEGQRYSYISLPDIWILSVNIKIFFCDTASRVSSSWTFFRSSWLLERSATNNRICLRKLVAIKCNFNFWKHCFISLTDQRSWMYCFIELVSNKFLLLLYSKLKRLFLSISEAVFPRRRWLMKLTRLLRGGMFLFLKTVKSHKTL